MIIHYTPHEEAVLDQFRLVLSTQLQAAGTGMRMVMISTLERELGFTSSSSMLLQRLKDPSEAQLLASLSPAGLADYFRPERGRVYRSIVEPREISEQIILASSSHPPVGSPRVEGTRHPHYFSLGGDVRPAAGTSRPGYYSWSW
ncbi:hypothetical protein HYV86_06335 [Candidatus Woesearchaeota archaeon]|nr:hypothetical protein [Candidatus Woesearchaeota archaeon]